MAKPIEGRPAGTALLRALPPRRAGPWPNEKGRSLRERPFERVNLGRAQSSLGGFFSSQLSKSTPLSSEPEAS